MLSLSSGVCYSCRHSFFTVQRGEGPRRGLIHAISRGSSRPAASKVKPAPRSLRCIENRLSRSSPLRLAPLASEDERAVPRLVGSVALTDGSGPRLVGAEDSVIAGLFADTTYVLTRSQIRPCKLYGDDADVPLPERGFIWHHTPRTGVNSPLISAVQVYFLRLLLSFRGPSLG